jgi:ABC-2 type transport system ATP-binding protein
MFRHSEYIRIRFDRFRLVAVAERLLKKSAGTRRARRRCPPYERYKRLWFCLQPPLSLTHRQVASSALGASVERITPKGPCRVASILRTILEMDSALAVDMSAVRKTFPKAFGYVAWLRSRGRTERRTVLSDITFGVRRGELFGLLGANGAGKSTVLRMLAGLVQPDSGRIAVGGVDALSEPLKMRAQLGLCTGDERSFYYRLTARSNLEYFGALAGIRRAALPARIEEVAATVDLSADLDRRFDEFSAGMRQRLSFARALLGAPEVLLLDEPTRAVDPVHTYELRRFIRHELVDRQGKTVVLATNLLDEAWELCDRIAVLRAGRIVTIASPDELGRMTQSGLRYSVDVDIVDDALLSRVRSVPGVLNFSHAPTGSGACLSIDLDQDTRTLTNLLQAVSANGVSVLSIRPDTVRPADIFSRLTDVTFDV